MSNIDKQALRDIAESVEREEWEVLDNGDDEYQVIVKGSLEKGGTYRSYQPVANEISGQKISAFIAAFNPVTMLALLDELEAMHKYAKDRDAENEGLMITVGRLRVEKEAAEKRIAELEAREVKLPNPHAHLIWIQAGHAPDDFWDDVEVSHSEKDRCCDGSERYPVYARWEIEEVLTAAGIKVEAE